MKKNVLVFLTFAAFLVTPLVFAADDTAIPAPADTVSESVAPAPTESTPAAEAVQAPAAASVSTPVAAAPAASVEGIPAETPANENLEFVSGEVSAIDAAAKSVTVKLYGENDEATTDKTLTVTTDKSTDITDGEKDRELGSLAAGTEVDVEYDPATKKATYIFVY